MHVNLEVHGQWETDLHMQELLGRYMTIIWHFALYYTRVIDNTLITQGSAADQVQCLRWPSVQQSGLAGLNLNGGNYGNYSNGNIVEASATPEQYCPSSTVA